MVLTPAAAERRERLGAQLSRLLHLITTTPVLDDRLPKDGWHLLALTCKEARSKARSLDRVIIVRDRWLEAPNIPTRFPGLREVILHHYEADPAFLADIPTLQRLEVRGGRIPAHTSLLLRQPLPRLQVLQVNRRKKYSGLATWLQFAARCCALTDVRFYFCKLNQDLAVLSSLPSLSCLDIFACSFVAEGVAALAALTGLTKLNISSSAGVAGAGLTAWAALSRLQSLSIDGDENSTKQGWWRWQH